MTKGTLVAAILLMSAVVFAIPAAGEIISQVGAPPASFATYDLEVDLTPWGYIEFSQVPFVPVDIGKGDYGDEGDQSQTPTEKLSEREALLRLLQQKVPCKWDWDCKKLEKEISYIPVDQEKCVGTNKVYGDPGSPLVSQYIYLINELGGKRYTEYLQVGYKITFKCAPGEDGQKYCVPDKVKDEPVVYKCKYGCLVTPVEKNGKVYSNFCVCKPGYDKSKGMFCDPSRGPHVYYIDVDWTCEETVQVAGYCPEGFVCDPSKTTVNHAECKPLSAQELFEQKGIDVATGRVQDGTERYTLLFPKDMSSEPIKVAFIRNGRVIAERPISDLTAWEYIERYGPVDAGMAYEFALKTGLVAEVAYALKDEDTSPALAHGTVLNVNLTEASTDEPVYRLW